MSEGELILYATEDGAAEVHLRAVDGRVWLSLAQIAELFGTAKQDASMHMRSIFGEGEVMAEAVAKDFFTTDTDGKACRTKIYDLDAILAVGYRFVCCIKDILGDGSNSGRQLLHFLQQLMVVLSGERGGNGHD